MEREDITQENEATTENAMDESQPAAETEASDTTEESIDETQKLQIEVAEAKDKFLRLYSEFENFRRRTAKERIELIGTASRDVIEALIPVLDDFERAIKAEAERPEGAEPTGIDLIYNKFKNVLLGKGLKKMETSAGDEFDDEFHEAITQIPAPDPSLAGKIVDVIEPGYFLSEKVIRFAKVVTAAKS